MAKSVLANAPECDVAILVVDSKRDVSIDDHRIEIIWAQDTEFPNYLSAAFKYNIIEFNTALKPHVASMLLRRYQKVIYLDPDVYVFGSLDPLLDKLDKYDFLLSPHTLTPYPDDLRPDVFDLLRFGAYNLGFFAARRAPNTQALIDWWDHCCQRDCWYEPALGLGVDQKWMDLVPAFFNNVHILRSPGVNVAFWNLHERVISKDGNGRWIVNGEHPLLFFHFSSFDNDNAAAIAKKQTRFAPGSRSDFLLARTAYSAALRESSESIRTSSTEYGYSQMSDGRVISPALRRFFAAQLSTQFASVVDPFEAGGSVHAFGCRHRLFSAHASSEAHVGFKAEDQFKRQKRILDAGFRLILRLIGADRYFLLMRYLSHYSSILKQTDLLR